MQKQHGCSKDKENKGDVRSRSAVHKKKNAFSHNDWAAHMLTLKPGGEPKPGFQIALPALPSPFPSPAHGMDKKNDVRQCFPSQTTNFSNIVDRQRYLSTARPVTHPAATQGAQPLARAWQSRTAPLPPRGPQKPRSNSLPALRKNSTAPAGLGRATLEAAFARGCESRPSSRKPSSRASTAPAGSELSTAQLVEAVIAGSLSGESKPQGVDVAGQRKPSTALAGKSRKASQDVDVFKLRKELNMPREAMIQACALFQRHADQANTRSGLLKDRRLTEIGFSKLWWEMTHQDEGKEDDVPEKILQEAFRHASNGAAQGLEFSQFAIWFSSRYFCEDVILDRPRRKLRSIAREHKMNHDSVETYEKIFTSFDTDGSGTIDPSEFEELLYQSSKVPSDIGLPALRIKDLWNVADKDNNKEISFQEFLSFHSKYLGNDSTGFEDFYQFGGRPVVS